MRTCIIIPIYKQFGDLDVYEKTSLNQCFKLLNTYKIIFICSHVFDPSSYVTYAKYYAINPEVKRFSGKYFYNVKGYNTLMLRSEFYKSFLPYNFMLLYQTDAYVFKDVLNEWCFAGIDYVGAPWIEYKHGSSEPTLAMGGNGGFSLRNVRKHYHLAKKIERLQLIDRILRYSLLSRILPVEKLLLSFWKMSFQPKEGFSITMLTRGFYAYNEDGNWSLNIALSSNDFVVANPDTAMKFSFEKEPILLYNKNNQQLPFGCHAFPKYNWEFWSKHITLADTK